jgi:hypothetical protein
VRNRKKVTLYDGLGHSSKSLDLLDNLQSFIVELISERLHHIGSSPRVNDLSNSGLLLQYDLGVSGNTRREHRRQSERLVERVRVQRLSATKHGAQRFYCGTDNVVVGILVDHNRYIDELTV